MWSIILFGVQMCIVCTYSDIKQPNKTPLLFAMLQLLHVFEQQGLQGLSLSEQDIRKTLGKPHGYHWAEQVQMLLVNGVIRRSKPYQYRLNVQLNDIYLSDILNWMSYPDASVTSPLVEGSGAPFTSQALAQQNTATVKIENPSVKQMIEKLTLHLKNNTSPQNMA